ncbi:VTT domain-containing protein [Acinetobacter sp. CFCC 10889]|uniref:VTT domain-containing protein n=1 Tax=Acinetobacter sp. CFCC 10889 TaxID=1775557 RepID=UPI000DD00975|nr:VTT domain-containing protein [Acinetobacter sp. CFCC 10889]
MIDFLMHIEQLLPVLLDQYGLWIYAILFLIIFAETGSVFMFFLPGDSLLIAIGALCSTAEAVHLSYMGILLIIASILGYIVNYYTGRALGFRFFKQHPKIFKPEYIEKTNAYFLKHGGKTIMMARFIPFVRSFAPFAAGAGHMKMNNFMFYNVLGGFIWIGVLLGIGYGTGNLISYTVDLF